MDGFGAMLRRCRMARSLSQERLAESAEVSTRHVSFLETGRSTPSREMVLVLANALDLPLRDRNTLLLAAGYAPAYSESPLASVALTDVRAAMQRLLDRHEPYPAMVFDRLYEIQMLNQGAIAMMQQIVSPTLPPQLASNLLHTLLHPEGVRAVMVNWLEVAAPLLARLALEVEHAPHDGELRALLQSLLQYPDAQRLLHAGRLGPTQMPFLTTHFRKGALELRMFTMIATLGTPLDVTAQELRLELYFPADEDSTRVYSSLVSSSARGSS